MPTDQPAAPGAEPYVSAPAGSAARCLDAAAILNPGLRRDYEIARVLNAHHGKTYYLATLLLPPAKRPFVHALYGFARYADEVVDDLGDHRPIQEKAAALDELERELVSCVAGGASSIPVVRAVADTISHWQLDMAHFAAFMHSMRMDLSVTSYDTYDDLYEYVYGSAAVIGLQMVPILEPSEQRAFEHAKDLGVAFQLANFIRDVGEDLERGRIYLPLDELAQHGVTPEVLNRRVATPEVKTALAQQIQRVRTLQRDAEPGIAMLDPASQPCIRAASVLYCGIVDEVEKIDYDVFNKRAKVGLNRRLAVAGRAWIDARAAR
jgi:phytoene synthase